jgi:hypothetical protein
MRAEMVLKIQLAVAVVELARLVQMQPHIQMLEMVELVSPHPFQGVQLTMAAVAVAQRIAVRKVQAARVELVTDPITQVQEHTAQQILAAVAVVEIKKVEPPAAVVREL